MTPEQRIKNKVRAALKEAGAYFFFPAMGVYGRAGVPDIVACMNGQFIGIECKAANKQPTELQAYELDKIAFAGGLVWVANAVNVDEVVSDLIKLAKRHA
jgi:Holliday junction resolvase